VIIAAGSQNAFPQNQTAQKFLVANLNQVLVGGSQLTLASGEQALVSFTLNQETQQLMFSLPQIQDNLDYQLYLSATNQGVGAIQLQPTPTNLGTLLTTLTTTQVVTQRRGGPPAGLPGTEQI
jgi:hypothetical protein